MNMQTARSPEDTKKLIGTFRRFGKYGPVYEIIAVRVEGTSSVVDLEVPESGDKVTVPLAEVLQDPKAT